MSYGGEYDASEYPDGIHAPRLGFRGAREMAELRATKDAEVARLRDAIEQHRRNVEGLGFRRDDTTREPTWGSEYDRRLWAALGDEPDHIEANRKMVTAGRTTKDGEP